MRFITLLILILLGFRATGQTYDSLTLKQALDSALMPDSAAVDTVVFSMEYDSSDSAYANVQYTQTPHDLTITRQESEKTYRRESFDKEQWKKIIGNTSYSEKAEEKKEQRKTSLPNFTIDPLVLKVIGYIVILGLLGYLIYLFIKQALIDPNRNLQRGASLYTDLTDPEHVADLDLEKLLQEALAENNLRLAVRLYYIKLLKHLNREGFIHWEKNKTNRDYANELASNGFGGQFKKIMTAYEYVWYGERTPSVEEFAVLESNFKTLYQTQRS